MTYLSAPDLSWMDDLLHDDHPPPTEEQVDLAWMDRILRGEEALAPTRPSRGQYNYGAFAVLCSPTARTVHFRGRQHNRHSLFGSIIEMRARYPDLIVLWHRERVADLEEVRQMWIQFYGWGLMTPFRRGVSNARLAEGVQVAYFQALVRQEMNCGVDANPRRRYLPGPQ